MWTNSYYSPSQRSPFGLLKVEVAFSLWRSYWSFKYDQFEYHVIRATVACFGTRVSNSVIFVKENEQQEEDFLSASNFPVSID